VVLSINSRNCRDNGCLDRDRYLGNLKDGTRRRYRKEGWGGVEKVCEVLGP
jgi:hypothetical protein